MNVKRFCSRLAALLLLTCVGAVDAQAQTTDLSITKTLTDPAIPPAIGITTGTDIVYTVVVTNNGSNSALSVSVADLTPLGLSFASNTGDCTTSYPCALGTITAGASRTITTTYTVPPTFAPPTAVVNTATVSSATTDPVGSNNSSTVTTPVNGINCGNFSVSGGTAHTCAIVAGNGKMPPNDLEDDVLECWGDNFSDQSAPVPTGSFAQVSAGAFHSCGLGLTGGVTCWGDDSSNQVSGAPDGTDFTQIDSGFSHTCGLRSDNSIVCWGDDSFGQSSAPAGLFVQVAAGNVHSCGLLSDGTIQCWGFDGDEDMSGDPIVTGVPTADDFVQVVAGGEHACGRHEGGSVDCWGSDYGSGETADAAGPFASVTAGDEHNCGLRDDGTIECWGNNSVDQLNSPGDAFTSIDAGAYHTCGLLSDGTILCWGDDSAYQSTPPGRSDLCPTCGDNVLEGRETCEACAGLGDPTPCSPVTAFAACCSPVTCTAYRLSENHTCRSATGACDAPEVCDGINFSTCPAPGPLRPNGFVCRAALGSCDPAETCTGTSNACPTSLPFLPSTALCRAVAGSCDVAENCTGSSAVCPTDVVVAASTTCRAVAGICDIVEVCSGSDAECPADVLKTAAATCRTSAGICDAAEVCSGTAAACPNDAFASVAVTCRPSSTLCDAQELCTGSSAACPADVLAPSITPCRAVNGGCDVVERCTGTSTVCPPNLFASPGTTCRSSIGVCDAAETCLGSTNTCPTDLFSSSTITCRAAVDTCDVAEKCTGTANSCPANSFAVSGTACIDGSFCNGTDTCNGSGGCSLHAGDPCPGPDGDGNCAETCNEASDNCSSPDPNGSSCVDTDACTNGEQCTSGSCGGGTVTDCNDGDVCTFDTCDLDNGCVHLPGIEESGCLTALRGQLFIKNSAVPEDAQLKWAWKKGQVLPPALLGTPSVDTAYALCIFDRSGGGATLVGSYLIPAGAVGWKEKATRVVFSNKDLPPYGIYKMGAKSADVPGKAGATLKGSGALLQLFDPVASNLYLFHEPSVVAQLRNSEGACLTTEFFAADFKKNWDNTVKAGYSR